MHYYIVCRHIQHFDVFKVIHFLWTTETEILNGCWTIFYIHLRYQLKTHGFKGLILGHNGNGRWIGCLIVEFKVNSGWWSPHKIASILRQAEYLVFDFGLIGMSDPWSDGLAIAASLALNESLLFLVEGIKYWLQSNKH